MSEIEKRIEEVLAAHRFISVPSPGDYCSCQKNAGDADFGMSRSQQLSHAAAAVVEALALTPEFESYAIPDSSRRRWVSSWETL